MFYGISISLFGLLKYVGAFWWADKFWAKLEGKIPKEVLRQILVTENVGESMFSHLTFCKL